MSNYAETNYAYDSMGRQDEVTSPEGTIRKSTFHTMGWLESEEVGTSAGNLRTVTEYEYDDGNDGGDGNRTKRTAIVGMNSEATYSIHVRGSVLVFDGSMDIAGAT